MGVFDNWLSHPSPEKLRLFAWSFFLREAYCIELVAARLRVPPLAPLAHQKKPSADIALVVYVYLRRAKHESENKSGLGLG